ncbi:MAG: HAMP domain-containing protein [Spirochaetales bacterium]|nr:HAMP domain-containing protein [Spirochaetales bacterium]
MGKKKKSKITPIALKINLIIFIVLMTGIGFGSFLFGYGYFLALQDKIQSNLLVQSDILYKAIEKYMLLGKANIAMEFFDDIGTISPEYTIKLFRTTGKKAFSDNSTIETVNKNLGTPFFEPKVLGAPDTETLQEKYLQGVMQRPPQDLANIEQIEDNTFFHMYKPLINLPKCTGCHGSDHTVRGIIAINNNITRDLQEQFLRILLIGGVIFLVLTAILLIIITQYLKRAVLVPVKAIGDVCSQVTAGIFSTRVNIKRNDEIGLLGQTVNSMAKGLHERFELSKFVSSKTIQSLTSEEKGKKVAMTILFSDIRGFTSYSAKRDAEEVVDSLNRILNIQTEIIHKNGGDVDKYVGDEIVSIFTDENSAVSACRAALDIQKEIEENSSLKYDNLHVGIGIHNGEVILGMIGSEKRADFTIIGDNVNVTSRLCDVAKPGQIIIHEAAYKRIKDTIKADGPYKLKVKGKEEGLHVYLISRNEGDGGAQ